MKKCISLIIVVFLSSLLFSQNDSVGKNKYKCKEPFCKQFEHARKEYQRNEKKREKQLSKKSDTLSPYFYSKAIDSKEGYSYFGARYYEPTISIWLPVEPEASAPPSSPSPYKYVSNPLKNIDAELTNAILEAPTILQKKIEKTEAEE